MDEEGNPTGPIEFERIVKERYLISKRTNTSYLDTENITVLERQLLLKFINEEIEAEQKLLEELPNNKNKTIKR